MTRTAEGLRSRTRWGWRGINLYQYAPNALGWVDPWGLSRECSGKTKPDFYVGPNGPSSTMPSTAYRYMDSKYAPQTIENKSAPLSYFGYTKYKSAHEAGDAYQIFMRKVILIHGVMHVY